MVDLLVVGVERARNVSSSAACRASCDARQTIHGDTDPRVRRMRPTAAN